MRLLQRRHLAEWNDAIDQGVPASERGKAEEDYEEFVSRKIILLGKILRWISAIIGDNNV